MNEIQEKRNLSGIYFIFNNPISKTKESRVFEDLPEDEQDKVLQNRSIEWYQSMIKKLASILRGIGDKFDIVATYEEVDHDSN